MNRFQLMSFDADLANHANRIIADGGIISYPTFASDLIRDLKSGPGNIYDRVQGLWVPAAVKKDSSNKVEKIYDLSLSKAGVYYDAIQSNSSNQQTWQDNQLDNKPIIQFNSSLSGYTATNIVSQTLPGVVIVICRKDGGGTTTRTIFDSATTRWNFAYRNNTTQLLISNDTQSSIITTDQTTWGQFTTVFGASGSGGTIRRKGVVLSSLNLINNDLSGNITIGMDKDGTTVHNGPIALVMFTDRLSSAQLNYVDLILNTKHFPSTIA